jgi:peptide/nickel transport system permease protein
MSPRLFLPLGGVTLILLAAISAPLLPIHDPLQMAIGQRLAPPSATYWLGQDEFGRDILSRLIWGARASLFVASVSAGVALVIGTALGVLGGFMRGIVEVLTMRSMDVVLCFPPILLALLIVTILGPGIGTLILVLSVLFVPGFVRVAYAGVLSVRSHEYVEAQRALGASRGRIMLRTILPNIAGPLLVQLSLAVASAIVLESGLSFLGLGVVPPSPSWGVMIRAARAVMDRAPLLLLFPCIALTLTIFAMNALCDALRDTFDPHARAAQSGRRRLLDFVAPGLLPPARDPLARDAVLALHDLSVEIETPAGLIHPVQNVSAAVAAGETLAIVGESGSGKSLTGLAAMGLLPPAARIRGGAVLFEGDDLARADEARLQSLRGGPMAMIFQDPMSSLNPVHRVGRQIAEAIRAHQPVSWRQAHRQAVALLAKVGIPDPERRARAFPYELSGGMQQRVMIAIAVANGPRLLIADEPTTALDVTIQAQVLQLLDDLKRESGLAMIFITHSLPVVAEIADRVVVMYAGQVVEEGRVTDVFSQPLHPYTAALIASAPSEGGPAPAGIPGTVPPPNALPHGCRFAPRCTRRIDACEAAPPPLISPEPRRSTRCIRWAER